MHRRVESWIFGAVVLLLIAIGSCRGQMIVDSFKISAGGGGGGPNPPASPLVDQDFDGAGYANSESWTENLDSGTVNEDYATSPAPLEGDQSLFMSPDAAPPGNTYTYHQFGDTDPCYGYMLFRPVSHEFTQTIVQFWDSGFAVVLQIDYIDAEQDGDGVIRVYHGTVNATTTGEMTEGTTYHVFFDYTNAGESQVGFSTDGTRPTSGANYAITSGGDGATDANRIALGGNSSDFQNQYIIDQVWVDDEQIPEQN